MSKRALIISVDEYRFLTPFGGRVSRDAVFVRQLIGDPIFGAFRAVQSEDDDSETIRRKLEDFLGAAEAGHQRLLYFIGHADRFPGNPFSLAAVDSRARAEPGPSLTAQGLIEALLACRAKEISVILDCCHSAHFLDEMVSWFTNNPALDQKLKRQGRSIELLISGNESVVHGDRTQFSRALLEGIRSGAAGGRKPVCTLQDLARHVLVTNEVSTGEQIFGHFGFPRDHLVSNSPNHQESISGETFDDLYCADVARKVAALRQVVRICEPGSSAPQKRRAHDILQQFYENSPNLPPEVRAALAPWLATRGRAAKTQEKRHGPLIIFNTRNTETAWRARDAFGKMHPKPCMFDLDQARAYRHGNIDLMEWLAGRHPTFWILDQDALDDLEDRDRDVLTVLETMPELDNGRAVYLLGSSENNRDAPFLQRSRWMTAEPQPVELLVRAIRRDLDARFLEQEDACNDPEPIGRGVLRDADLFFLNAHAHEAHHREMQRSEPQQIPAHLPREPNFMIFRQEDSFVMAICDTRIDPAALHLSHEKSKSTRLATDEEVRDLGFIPGQVDPMFLDPSRRFSRVYVDANILFQHLMYPSSNVRVPRYDQAGAPKEVMSVSTFIRTLQQMHGERKVVFANIRMQPKLRDKLLWAFIEANFTHTRFAPSPSNSLHVGSLRTALISYLFAVRNKEKGRFHVRFDDTNVSDQADAEANMEAILRDLAWAGIAVNTSYRQTGEEARRNYHAALALLQRSGMCEQGTDGAIAITRTALLKTHYYWLDLKRGPQVRHVAPMVASNGKPLNYSLTSPGAVFGQRDQYRYKFAGAIDDVIHNSLVVRDNRQDHSFFTSRQAAILAILRETLAYPRDRSCGKLGDQLRRAALRRDANMASLRASPFPCPPAYLHVTRVADADGGALSKRNLPPEQTISFIRRNFLYFPETIIAWCLASFGWKALRNAGFANIEQIVREFALYGMKAALPRIAARFGFIDLVDIPQKDTVRISGLAAIERHVLRQMSPSRLSAFALDVLAESQVEVPAEFGEFLIRLHDHRMDFAGCSEISEIIRCYAGGRVDTDNEEPPRPIQAAIALASASRIESLNAASKALLRNRILGHPAGARLSVLRCVLGARVFTVRSQQGQTADAHESQICARSA